MTIRVSRGSPALELEVEGDDRIRVEGLLQDLNRLLDGGGRRLSWWSSWITMGIAVGLFPGGLAAYEGLLALLRSHGLAGHGRKFLTGDFVLIGLMATLVLIVGPLLVYLFPDLELLAAGDQPRAKRFGRWVIGAMVVVILGIVSGVIATLLLR